MRKSYARACLGHTILATGDSRIEHQLQADATVKQKRLGDRDLRLHTRFESIAAWCKGTGTQEAVQKAWDALTDKLPEDSAKAKAEAVSKFLKKPKVRRTGPKRRR